MKKYLGLPIAISRSKKMVFAVLKERVWKKLQGCKEKLLSGLLKSYARNKLSKLFPHI